MLIISQDGDFYGQIIENDERDDKNYDQRWKTIIIKINVKEGVR